MNQWETIYKTLKAAGIDVYSPGQHQGECTAPYTVVKDAGLTPLSNFSSTQTQYDILCYVPAKKYSMLYEYVEKVKDIMKSLAPAIKPMNFQTGSFLDDTVKGHMVSVQYTNARKL